MFRSFVCARMAPRMSLFIFIFIFIFICSNRTLTSFGLQLYGQIRTSPPRAPWPAQWIGHELTTTFVAKCQQTKRGRRASGTSEGLHAICGSIAVPGSFIYTLMQCTSSCRICL